MWGSDLSWPRWPQPPGCSGSAFQLINWLAVRLVLHNKPSSCDAGIQMAVQWLFVMASRHHTILKTVYLHLQVDLKATGMLHKSGGVYPGRPPAAGPVAAPTAAGGSIAGERFPAGDLNSLFNECSVLWFEQQLQLPLKGLAKVVALPDVSLKALSI